MPSAVLLDDTTVNPVRYVPYVPDVDRSQGDVVQLSDGRAGVLVNSTKAGFTGQAYVSGRFGVVKNATPNLLDGGRVYWDRSAAQCDYRRVGDRDFYLGRAFGDTVSGSILAPVDLNVDVRYDGRLTMDPFDTAIVKTAGSPLLNYRGGCVEFVLDATNEAQKVDALARDTFSRDANAIVEMAFCVANGSAGGAPDFNLGIAGGTNATDADAIVPHVFVHLDGNSTAINFQSKDGTTTVAAAASGQTYSAGSALANRVECWIDCRDTTSVKVYVNGARVLSGTTFRIDNAASEFRLLAHVEKTAAADQFDVLIDWLRVRFMEK